MYGKVAAALATWELLSSNGCATLVALTPSDYQKSLGLIHFTNSLRLWPGVVFLVEIVGVSFTQLGERVG